jgi:hypothetical protein
MKNKIFIVFIQYTTGFNSPKFGLHGRFVVVAFLRGARARSVLSREM